MTTGVSGWQVRRSAHRRVIPLLRACHLQPTLAVTAITATLAASAGRGAGTLAVAVAVLAGQLSVGWSNDFVDRGRDRARRPSRQADRRRGGDRESSRDRGGNRVRGGGAPVAVVRVARRRGPRRGRGRRLALQHLAEGDRGQRRRVRRGVRRVAGVRHVRPPGTSGAAAVGRRVRGCVGSRSTSHQRTAGSGGRSASRSARTAASARGGAFGRVRNGADRRSRRSSCCSHRRVDRAASPSRPRCRRCWR